MTLKQIKQKAIEQQRKWSERFRGEAFGPSPVPIEPGMEPSVQRAAPVPHRPIHWRPITHRGPIK